MKTTMRAFLLTVFAAGLMLAPGTSASAAEPSPVSGKWSGFVNQKDDRPRWAVIKVNRKLVKGESAGTVSRGLPCGTSSQKNVKFIYLRRKASSYYFKLTGRTCWKGKVRLKRAGKKISILWTPYDVTPNGETPVRGTLSHPPKGGKPSPVAGNWAGNLTDGQNDSVSVSIKINKRSLVKGKLAGRASYPVCEGGGSLTFLRREGKTYVFREQAGGDCDEGGPGTIARIHRNFKNVVYQGGTFNMSGTLSPVG